MLDREVSVRITNLGSRIAVARSSAILAVAALAAACGTTPSVQCPGASVSSAEIEAFLEEVATRRCAAALRCVPDEVQRSQSLISEAHCVDRFVGELRSRAIPRAVSEGTVCFDLTERAACLAAVERDGCEDRVFLENPFVWPTECASVVTAVVPPEGACAIDEECTSGSCFCGACAAPFDPPESCAEGACGTGFACNEALECVPAGGEGDACTRPFAERMGTCRSNLLCVDGVCHRPDEYRTASVGEDCYSPRNEDDPLVWCQPGLACRFDVGGEPGTCEAPLAEGELCEGGAHGICEPGTICQGPAGEARCAPFAAVGEECFSSGLGDPCEAGSICALGESRCEPLGDEGDPCSSGLDCYGFCNDGVCERSSTAFCG